MDYKFRAWDKDGQEMKYIHDLYWFEEEGIKNANDNDYYIFMQYTGLKDKNGKEGYFKDIVSLICYTMQERAIGREKGKYIIEWNDKKATYYLKSMSENYDDIENWWEHLPDGEIIGNVYENKELLKGQINEGL